MTAPRDMVVDDDADLRGLICDYLAANGYKVCGAASSREMDTHLRTAIPTIWPLHRPDPGLERVANGLSLHAGVSCETHQKDKRERLCSELRAKRGMSFRGV